VGVTVLGVDGGNTKTDLAAATLDGEVVAYVRGPGSNSHGPRGAAGCVEVIAALVDGLAPFEHAAYFLCGADVPQDIADLTGELEQRQWSRGLTVDNDTFALLRTGTEHADAVAVICGAGINSVGRNARGEVARYPALGWETGDWGGGEPLGRAALYEAARAEDGRGEPTVLVELVRSHFGAASVVEVGKDVHYRRLDGARLGELAPAVVDAAAAGDLVALRLVERLADEIVALAERSLRDLGLVDADLVLGGGMLDRRGLLYDLVVERLPAGVRPVVPSAPPVVGALLDALASAGAAPAAASRVRARFESGLAAKDVR
jgi:N-acetylglucosamine kinase-like BadF-type ATPase